MRASLIFKALIVLLFSCRLLATDYYVAKSGNDSTGNGLSWGTAWLTMGKANTAIAPGDTVTVRTGRYDERIICADSNVVWAAEFIADRTATTNTSTAGFHINGLNNITIRGFEVTDLRTPVDVLGFRIDNSSTNCVIEQNFIHHQQSYAGGAPYGIRAVFTNTHGLIIRSNILWRVEGMGIGCSATESFICDNEIYRGSNTNLSGVKVFDDCDCLRIGGVNIVVSNNWLHDYILWDQYVESPYSAMPHIDAIMIFSQGGGGILNSNITFINNTFESIEDQGIITRDIFDTNAASVLITHISFINNVFRGVGNGSYMLNLHDAPHTTIVGNTFLTYGTNAAGTIGTNVNGSVWTPYPLRMDAEGAKSGCRDSVVVNNIFYGFSNTYSVSIDIFSLTNTVIDYNLWYPAPTGIPLASPNDVHSVLNSNPLFADLPNSNWRLQASSPAIGAGSTLAALYSVDKAGVVRSAPWDIGAYEYVVTNAPNVPRLSRLKGVRLRP